MCDRAAGWGEGYKEALCHFLMRLRALEFTGRGAAGPWVVWNPAPNAPSVNVNSLIFNAEVLGTHEVLILLFRMSMRSNFTQRLAMAKWLKWHRADRRIVWSKDHEFLPRVERLVVGLTVRRRPGSDDGLFLAVVGEAVPFRVEVFGVLGN